jgi:MerR family mercuric resistance operon transcriptional regulator
MNIRTQTLLTRGELAKQTDVNRETIRFYERNGLLKETTRTETGYYLFTPVDVKRVRFIKRAQAVGFSLTEIKALLELKFDEEDATCGDVRALATTKINEIERKIETLLTMKALLQELIDECPGGVRPVSDCPILESFSVTD